MISSDNTGSADVIYAGEGADWVMAGGGNDVVFGEIGDDGDTVSVLNLYVQNWKAGQLGINMGSTANDARYGIERKVA